jgi:hypothetical protein
VVSLLIRKCRTAFLAALAFLFILIAPSLARADEALARQHFKKGIDLYDKKQYAEALSAFQDAYKEKPSPGIKQNIALCYKGLNKYVEAATAFDDALADGATLKPDTRAAIERELTDLSRDVATVSFTVTTADKKPIDHAIISIEPSGEKPYALTPEAQKRPVRLMPGLYTFSAKASGYPDYRKPQLSLVPGPPVDLMFVLGAGAGAVTTVGGSGGTQGTLKVRPSVADAAVRIDGKDVGRGPWEGTLGAETHKVEVEAPGWKSTSVDVTVPAGGSVDYPITLQAISDAPPEYVASKASKPKKEKRLYLVPMVALDAASYRLSTEVGEPPGGTRRDFSGATLSGRVGYYFWKFLSAEALLAAGSMSAEYNSAKTTIDHWQLTPALRFTIPRGTLVRFTAASGFGVHGLTVDAKLPTRSHKGNGVGWSWLIEAGAQIDLGPVFVEAAIVLDVHSIPSVRDDEPPENRFLLSSPAVRGGGRIGLGIPF